MYPVEVIEHIIKKVLKETVLDVYTIISQAGEYGISKIDILQTYQAAQGVDTESSKFRTTIDVAIATLIGTTFVEYRSDGVSNKYHLSDEGKAASEVLLRLINENSDMTKNTVILSKALKGDMAYE